MQRINHIGEYLRYEFGFKVIKLSIDGGFTCPNRDGAKGTGGCIFCSEQGSGELAGTIEQQLGLLHEKWPSAGGYIAYFQSHTNTYAPAAVLREKYEDALRFPGVVGLAAATRPDCIPDDVLDLLEEFSRKTYLWVELGLQTCSDDTAMRINRCYPLSDYDDCVKRLTERGIRVVTHLIFGLPGETREDMEASVRHVAAPVGENEDGTEKHIFGMKLHMLNVVRNTALMRDYPGYSPFSSPEEYVSLVCDMLEIIPADITMHRLTGDVPRKLLVAPEWSYKKRTILNGIEKEMKRRGSYQGCRAK